MCSGCSIGRTLFLALLLTAGCAPDVICAPEGRLCTAVGVLGVSGFNGEGAHARASWLFYPTALALDADGALVLTDLNNNLVRGVAEDGTLTTLVGTGAHYRAIEGAAPRETGLEHPSDVQIGAHGDLFLAEYHAGRVLAVVDGAVTILAGRGELGFDGDGGPAVDAALSEAASIAVGEDGLVYIADTDNHVIRVIGGDGTLRTVAGVPGTPGLEDGAPGALHTPQRIRAVDGGLVIADTGNHAIRFFDPQTGALSTWAGDGTPGYTGDGGPATGARLREPHGAQSTPDGGLLVADSGNHVVRWIDPSGTMRTLVGTGQPGRDGNDRPPREAQLNFPVDALPDGAGGLYVADMLNSGVRHVAGLFTAP